MQTKKTSFQNPVPGLPNLHFRYFCGESDYPVIKRIFDRCMEVDQLERTLSLDDIHNQFEHLTNCDPYTDMIFAEDNGQPVAYNRVAWKKEEPGDYVCFSVGQVVPGLRRKGIGGAIVQWAEARQREIAAGFPTDAPRIHRVSIDDKLLGARELFQSMGYQPLRQYLKMVRPIDGALPDAPMPPGIEIRPVEESHYRMVFDALYEIFRDTWSFIEPTEGDYQRRLDDPKFNPALWKVAWAGDQVVGMVLNFVDEDNNRKFKRKRGWTEDIAVRGPWRKRGLATALIAESIRMFRQMGFEETTLSVDNENPSGALQLYEYIGYTTVNSTTYYKKPMENLT